MFGDRAHSDKLLVVSIEDSGVEGSDLGTCFCDCELGDPSIRSFAIGGRLCLAIERIWTSCWLFRLKILVSRDLATCSCDCEIGALQLEGDYVLRSSAFGQVVGCFD